MTRSNRLPRMRIRLANSSEVIRSKPERVETRMQADAE